MDIRVFFTNIIILYKHYFYFFHFLFFAGGEDGKPTGWSPADPSRRRNSGPIVNAGSLSKQKSPVANEASMSKDVLVSAFLLDLGL